jgi:DNA-binding XRE family transcriptional regulator
MIYFIKHTDYVKIGYTTDIHKRLSQLQTSCPTKLKVLALIEGSLDDERVYQEKFKHLSTSGEWFTHTQGLENFINSLSKELMWKHGFEKHESSPIGAIKSCRLKKNLSMEDLADRLGVTKQAIYNIELREAQGRASITSVMKVLEKMGYRYQYRAVEIPSNN